VNGGWSCSDGENDLQRQDGNGMEAESVMIGSSQSGWKADRCLKERCCCVLSYYRRKNSQKHVDVLADVEEDSFMEACGREAHYLLYLSHYDIMTHSHFDT
jgi:hypothetical protein